MQELDPIVWGALDRFQAHFIVRKNTDGPSITRYVARSVPRTLGRFGSKSVLSVKWTGGLLADVLNGDEELNAMVSSCSPSEARITVEPTDGAVRIHGGWQNRHDLGVSREMFAIYDRIAGHVKSL